VHAVIEGAYIVYLSGLRARWIQALYTGYAPINSVDDTACKLGEGGGEATYALYVCVGLHLAVG
jgi:hypothetical protein